VFANLGPKEAVEAQHISISTSDVQQCLTACYSAQSATAYPSPEAHKNAITNKIARFICNNMQVIGIVL